MSANPFDTGRKVIDGFNRGRANAIRKAKERAAVNTQLVMTLAEDDVRRGKPRRGRAGRISRKLGDALKEAHIRKILRTLYRERVLPAQTPAQEEHEHLRKEPHAPGRQAA